MLRYQNKKYVSKQDDGRWTTDHKSKITQSDFTHFEVDKYGSVFCFDLKKKFSFA